MIDDCTRGVSGVRIDSRSQIADCRREVPGSGIPGSSNGPVASRPSSVVCRLWSLVFGLLSLLPLPLVSLITHYVPRFTLSGLPHSSLPPSIPSRSRKYSNWAIAVTVAATYVRAAADRTALTPSASSGVMRIPVLARACFARNWRCRELTGLTGSGKPRTTWRVGPWGC